MAPSARRGAPSIDWTAVAQALGKAGAIQPGDVYKVGLPRTDLHVSLDGVAINPSLALGSWAAFKQTDSNQAMVMGDLVLLESEVAPVIAKLQEGGIEPTAIHNHLLRESPHVMYLHYRGSGDPVKLATTLHATLVLTGTPFGAPPPDAAAALPGLDTAQLAHALGRSGKLNGAVYQVSVPRAEPVIEGGMEIPPAMGVATAINFQPTGDHRAAISGDFVLIASEVNPVIRALRENGIEIAALHSHMLDESPRLLFMHFWANDDAVKLAGGLQAALDLMNVNRPPS
ncbi:MAG: DUF1259 domain-containing protein [Gemmatimonadota bacterium]